MQPSTPADAARLEIRRHYPATPERVWRAWTNPQALSRWFGSPGSVTTAELDVRVGGRWRITSAAPGGETHEVSGVYQEVVPHRRLVFTWAWRSTPERVSRVSIDFRAVDGGTELGFVHDRFFDEQARINHERGWLPMFGQLAEFLAQDAREA